MKKTLSKTKSVTKYPRTAGDAYVTQRMLYKVRDELKEHIQAQFYGLDSKIQRLDSKIQGLDSKILGLHSKIQGLESKFLGLDSKFLAIDSKFLELDSKVGSLQADISDLKASVHRMELLAEEQNNRNKIVLDGLSHLFNRQERLETQFLEFKK